MAKSTGVPMTVIASEVKDFLSDHGDEYSPDYSMWRNKDEWAAARWVNSRVEGMYQARQKGCFLTTFVNSKSFDTHWDMVEKDYLMNAEYGDEDNFRSNIKSTMSYRTISAIDAKERRQDISFVVEERDQEDADRALLLRYVLEDYLKRNPDIRYRFFEASLTAKIFGTSFAYIPYTTKSRTVRNPERNDDGEVTYKEETIIDFDDIDFIPIHPRNFLVDGNSLSLHGPNNAATDCAWLTYPSLSQFRAEF